MISETTSGITVIRIAFTHSDPIGERKSAALNSGALAESEIAVPMPTAAPSAMRTRVDSFIYIIKSPPLMSNAAPVM
jgi:hypothetical protein